MAEPVGPAYIRVMSQTLESRVQQLEQKVAELSAEILGLKPRAKDWRRTVGSMEDDEITRSAEQLGRDYRKQQTYEQELARS